MQVTGVALVVLGVWIHIYRDTLFFTYLLRFNHTSSTATTTALQQQQQQHSISSSLSSVRSSQSAAVASLQSSFSDIISVDNCPFILIAAGCCVTTVGFLGCCGAYAESVCFLGFVSISRMQSSQTFVIQADSKRVYTRTRQVCGKSHRVDRRTL
jgi:hypothetical protein